MARIALDSQDLGRRWGIHFMNGPGSESNRLYALDESVRRELSRDGAKLGMDLIQPLVTAPNASIPALFTTYVDPAIIEVLVRPTKAAVLYGESKKGTWVSDTALFIVAERTGEVASYNDFSQNGMANANINYPYRQSYHFQTNTRWGERELQREAESRVDWASQLNMASALTLTKYMNLTYLYGVAGLQNYGGTNDPFLPASIVPTASWFGASQNVIYGDILRLVQQIIAQGNGILDAESEYCLGISPGNVTNFNTVNQFNVNVYDQLKKNFPNMKIVTVPEFAISGGLGVAGGHEFVQLIAPNVQGQTTMECVFTEKMRAHAVVTKTSSWEQKKSSGTWGTIVYYPAFVASFYS